MKSILPIMLMCCVAFVTRANPGTPNTETVTAAPDKQVTPDAARRAEAMRASMVIKVANPVAARAAMRARVSQLEGFVTQMNLSGVVFKLPPENLSKALELVAKEGVVIHKSQNRNDLTGTINQLTARLKSKTEIMDRLRQFLDESDVDGTLEIERTMTQLAGEIESIKGNLRLLEDQTRYARLDISFEFREREQVSYVASPFEWLNTTNLDTLLEEF